MNKLVKIVITAAQDTPRDNVLSMARPAGDVGRPTTSRQCASECRDSSRIRDKQGAAVSPLCLAE